MNKSQHRRKDRCQLQKSRHTAKLRAAYAASAQESLHAGQPWEDLADEVWLQLDKLEKARKK